MSPRTWIGWAGWSPTAGWSCCWPASTSPCSPRFPRRDRVEQIQWMREAMRRRFGVDATRTLAHRAGVGARAGRRSRRRRRAIRAGGRPALPGLRLRRTSSCTRPYWTESDGKRVALFPDRRATPVPDSVPPAGGNRRLSAGAARRRPPLAVLADDGEKFGGWPGTKEWVYEQGWLDRFMDTIGGLVERRRGSAQHLDGRARARAQRRASPISRPPPTARWRGGRCRPMPRSGSIRLERDLGEARMAGPDGALVRGAHWRNFLVKYSESNRMHKKMLALSLLLPRRRRPARGPPRHRPGPVQRRLLAWRLRRPLPAPPAGSDLAEPRGGGSGAAAGRGARRPRYWTSTATATTRSGSTPTGSRPW